MCILKGGSGSRWVDRLRVGVGYPVWGFRIETKSPDFRSPEVGISASPDIIHHHWSSFTITRRNSPSLDVIQHHQT